MKKVKWLMLFIVIVLIIPISANAYTVSVAIDDSLAGMVAAFQFDVSGDINSGAIDSAVPGTWVSGASTTAATGATFSSPPDYLLTMPDYIATWDVLEDGAFSLDDWLFSDAGGSLIPTDYTVSPLLVPASVIEGTNYLYTFRAVPVPPSVILLLSGMLGVVGFRRMKR
jgi:hypothetical protein